MARLSLEDLPCVDCTLLDVRNFLFRQSRRLHDGFDRHAKRQKVGGYPFLRFFLAFGSSFGSSFRKFFLLCRSYGVHNITVGIDAVFIQFQFLLVELGYLCLLEETGKHTLLQGSRAMH